MDADREMGFGHLERAIAVAQELALINYRTVFVTREGSLAAPRLRERGFSDIVTFDEPAGEADALQASGPGVIIFDVGSTKHEQVAAVKTFGCFVVTFEDLGDGRYLADLVVDANLTEATNPKRMQTTTRYLLGPEYAILASNVIAAKKKRRPASRGVRRVIVSCGGSDPSGVTPGVVRGLQHFDSDIEVEVVLGPAFAHPRLLDEALLKASRTFTIAQAPPDLPARLRAADLGILSGGITLFEAAHLGLPSLVIAQHATQLKNLAPFEARGGVVNLGLAANEPYANLPSAIRAVNEPRKLDGMSSAMEDYVDGKGSKRLSSAIRAMVGR